MSQLSDANTLFRTGRYQEALKLFTELYRSNQNFYPYRSGLLMTLKRLGRSDAEIRAYLSLDDRNAEKVEYGEAVHPESLAGNDAIGVTFVVVTPVLNGEMFIDQTIESVVSQKGSFFVEYLVKDGGSSDRTIAKLENWRKRIQMGEIPLQCRGLRFRFQSSGDSGLYDAVAQGFSLCPGSSHDVLTYINADDVFADDAFEIVEMLYNKVKNIRWICGQMNVIDESGQVLDKPSFPLAYAREDIRAGLHDGRALYFIQQEGSFWLRELYNAVGGLNRTLQLAGDFDLWRRFSAHTELLALSCNLASFRSHPNQLSRQLNQYYAEVDQLNYHDYPEKHHQQPFSLGSLEFCAGPHSRFPANHQRPGPVCFLTEDKQIQEIAYMNRGWFNW